MINKHAKLKSGVRFRERMTQKPIKALRFMSLLPLENKASAVFSGKPVKILPENVALQPMVDPGSHHLRNFGIQRIEDSASVQIATLHLFQKPYTPTAKIKANS